MPYDIGKGGGETRIEEKERILNKLEKKLKFQ